MMDLPVFEWFSWNSGQISQNVREIHGFPVRLKDHLLQDFQCRPWRVNIFWNSPVPNLGAFWSEEIRYLKP